MNRSLPKTLPLAWRDGRVEISPLRRVGLALALLLLMATGIVAGWFWQQRAATGSDLRALEARHAPIARAPENATTTRLLAEQTKALNGVVRHLNLPWDQLLEALRPETPDEVIVLGFDTDVGGETLRVQAEAEHSEAMTGYVQALARHARFTQATLVKHEQSERFAHRYRFTVELVCTP